MNLRTGGGGKTSVLSSIKALEDKIIPLSFRKRFVFKLNVAFTLAEVLITLGIIGIVAAMTVPTIIQKNDERVAVTKVKKYYSVMNQALLRAIEKNGYVDEWNYVNDFGTETNPEEMKSEILAAYFKPYLKIMKDCSFNQHGCVANQNYVLLNGSPWGNYDLLPLYSKMILADGTHLWIRRDNNTLTSQNPCTGSEVGWENNLCGGVWIDVNGLKQPNTIGKDIFYFVILKNRIMPPKIDDCNKDGEGWGCSAYILQHGDMKYLHK